MGTSSVAEEVEFAEYGRVDEDEDEDGMDEDGQVSARALPVPHIVTPAAAGRARGRFLGRSASVLASSRDRFDSVSVAPNSPHGGPQRSIEGWIILVTGVKEDAEENDIYDAFCEFGHVKDLHFNLERRTGYGKGYALVEYESFEEAQTAIRAMDGKQLLTKTVHVDWAFNRGPIQKVMSTSKFQQLASVELAEKCFGLSADGYSVSDKDETVNFEGMLTDQADKVGNVDAETCLNEMCQKDKPDHKKVGCRRNKMSTITETVERPKAAGRPMTQYFLFLQDFRKDKKKQPTVKISKAAAEKWKSMTNSEKAPYKSRYDELMRARRNPEPAALVRQLSSDLEAEPMHVPEHVQAAAPLILLSSDSEDVLEQAYGHPESASSSWLSGPEPSSCESVKSKYYL